MTDIKSDILQISSRNVRTTRFEGMMVFDLNIFEDKRGRFTEIWQTEAMQALGIPDVTPKQLGISRSKKGAIRAVHAEPYDKIISPLTGRIFCGMVDLRENSSTFGQVESFELDNTNMLYIPAGIGNGFQAISEEDVMYCYCTAGVWSAEKAYSGQYLAINYADPELGIDWPLKGDLQIVSNKDMANPTIKEAFPHRYE